MHSHLNHSCEPNVTVLHTEQKTALNRITIRTLSDVSAGDELFVTYVNPKLSVSERRKELKAWAFGTCMCSKCLQEEKEEAETEPKNESEEKDLESMEKELKEGLGLL